MKPGDVVTRIWGDGFMRSELRVVFIDDKFIFCDAQRGEGETEWDVVIPLGSQYWKFDKTYGVETDEEQGWGVEPYGRNVCLTRIVTKEGGD